MPNITEVQLRYLEYANRENDFRHHTDREEHYQYELIRMGDINAGEEHRRMLLSGHTGKVSVDKLRNQKYLFVAAVTMASRTAISAGMQTERALNASDLYIQKMDMLSSVEEVIELAVDMMKYYAKEVASIERAPKYSLPVTKCIDYIFYHMNEKLTVTLLAEQVQLNPSYLSTIFKKETGVQLGDYILHKRIETAKNMLRYSQYSYSEIASILAFSSQSHFVQSFKKIVGVTPKVFRNKYN